MSAKRRILNPCDGCAVRRVKCEDLKPCYQCRVRGLQCTSMYLRKKRGPRGGPRHTTYEKVEEFQESIRDKNPRRHDTESPNVDDIGTADGNHETDDQMGLSPMSSPCSLPPTVQPFSIPMDKYRHFIHLFQQQAFPIWPVVNSDDLLADLHADLSQPDTNPETFALAASLCAATIAQLRLPEHTLSPQRNVATSFHFVSECLRLRQLYDYRETYSIASVLIPFFLHIHYANSNKLRTAGLFLRESITYVQAMQLGSPQTYQHVNERERGLRLRIYWLLFISER